MIRRPPRSTRTDTLCPYTTLFRSSSDVPRFTISGVGYGLPTGSPPAFQPSKRVGPSASAQQIAAPNGSLPHFCDRRSIPPVRSEEHTSELQSLMRISYAVFCLKKKKHQIHYYTHNKQQ